MASGESSFFFVGTGDEVELSKRRVAGGTIDRICEAPPRSTRAAEAVARKEDIFFCVVLVTSSLGKGERAFGCGDGACLVVGGDGFQ